jgi:hypothetical protein
MEKMQDYRQPMVTASGIFLGFMLNFATGWVGHAFTKYMVRDVIVAISIMLCITLLIVVLYRMLNMNYPANRVDGYYRKTLAFFLIAVSVPFIAFVLVVLKILVAGTADNSNNWK